MISTTWAEGTIKKNAALLIAILKDREEKLYQQFLSSILSEYSFDWVSNQKKKCPVYNSWK